MRIMKRPNSSRAFAFPPASSIARRTGAEACTAFAIEGVSISVCVIRVCAERKQCFNGVDCFQALPRSPDSKVEQCGAVSSGCLQIRHVLCRSTDGLRIVSHDTLCDSEQRRLIAEVPSS